MPRLKPIPNNSKSNTRSERVSSVDSNTDGEDDTKIKNSLDYRCYRDFYALAECNKNVKIVPNTTPSQNICKNEEFSFHKCLES